MHKFIKAHAFIAIFILIGMTGLLIFNLFPEIDIICANYFYSPHLSFYLKHNWWLENFIHIYIKYSIILFVILIYIVIFYKKYLLKYIPKYHLGTNHISTNQRCKPDHNNLNFIKNINSRVMIISLITTILIPITISILKRFSSHSCPWDLLIYAGGQKLIEWWEYAPNVSGKCFPAGHAATGLCIMGISIIFYAQNNIKYTRCFYILGIAAGLILGIAQQARGAHFLSHTLASVYIACSITNIGIYIAKKYALK